MYLGRLAVHSPVTAGTNVLLTLQCALYALALHGGSTERARKWSGFFLGMGIATAAGVVKHGFGYALPLRGLDGVLWVSSAAGGVSTWAAQRAAAAGHSGTVTARARLERWATVQLAVFLAVNVLFGARMTLLVGNTLVGLSPVIAAEASSGRRGAPGGRRVAAGLLLSLVTGAVYVGRLSPGRWFNHIDLAHALMGVSFHLIYLGVRSRPRRPRPVTPVEVRTLAAVSGSSSGSGAR